MKTALILHDQHCEIILEPTSAHEAKVLAFLKDTRQHMVVSRTVKTTVCAEPNSGTMLQYDQYQSSDHPTISLRVRPMPEFDPKNLVIEKGVLQRLLADLFAEHGATKDFDVVTEFYRRYHDLPAIL